MGASFDSMRIGDGSGNYIGVNASDEALVHDTDSLAVLTTIDADTSSLAATITTEGGAQPANVLVVGGHTGAGISRHFLTDANGRLTVNVNSSSLPTGASTETTLAALLAELQLKADLTETQPVSVASLPLPAGAATQTTLAALLAELELKADLTETQPVSIAGTITITGGLTDAQLRATPVPVSGPLTDVQLRATAVPVSGTVTANLGTVAGLALDTNIDALRVLTGSVTETAPATDTASSGLNGRLQRVAQRITSLIALLPTSLGQKTMANSFAVTFASDQTGIQTTDAVQVGTYDQSLVVANSGVTTLTAPANAKSCKVMAGDANISNLRVTLDGSVPTNTRGIQFQAGRSEDFTGVVSLQVIAQDVATNQEIYVHWSA
jgi:sulfur carrier protein ThiS